METICSEYIDIGGGGTSFTFKRSYYENGEPDYAAIIIEDSYNGNSSTTLTLYTLTDESENLQKIADFFQKAADSLKATGQ